MNQKIYKTLMLLGKLPWRPEVLKKKNPWNALDILLRKGFTPLNYLLTWKGQQWKLFYKVVDDKPRSLPDFSPVPAHLFNLYHYIEFEAVSLDNEQSCLYACGNFMKGENKPFIVRGKQVIVYGRNS